LVLSLLIIIPIRVTRDHRCSPAFAEEIRESAIAGSWYPSSPAALREQIDGFLSRVPSPTSSGRLVALIAPHAGTAYSGQVAAHAYKQIGPGQKIETVLILAPSHRARFSGVAVHDRGGFRTPLGVVPLDREIIEDLKKRESRIRYVPDAHTLEHSLEIQLPFLQVVTPGFKLVPLLMGEQDLPTCQWLAEAIADSIRGKPVLVVASSDLSHFHDSEKARKLDQVVAERTSAFDPEGLSRDLASGKCEACGGGPMVTAMLIARKLGADRSQVLQYAHSGDVTGERSRVVGYMAAALWAKLDAGSAEKPAGAGDATIDLSLTPEEKGLLHRIARESIEARCKRKDPPRPEVNSVRLKEPRGAFVTLKKHGELRGCIGHIVGDLPLDRTISEMAVAAAFHDPRFPALTEAELEEIEIEISVLTPLKRIHRMEEITVGKHGIFMKRGTRSGLLLPQVATEQGWDCGTFVENTCRKAGLPSDAWKDPETEMYVFSAQIF
jgi:AmmeMemoRadiSam system protein B/AmmeMemoRadiSam system protein A